MTGYFGFGTNMYSGKNSNSFLICTPPPKKGGKFLDDKTNVVRPLTMCIKLEQLLFLTGALRLLIDTRKLSQKRKPDNNRLQILRTVMN